MFSYCSSLKEINIKNFDTLNVENMEGMFIGSSSLISLDLSNFQTPNLNNINNMFNGCYSLKILDISNFKLHPDTKVINTFYFNSPSLIIISNNEYILDLYKKSEKRKNNEDKEIDYELLFEELYNLFKIWLNGEIDTNVFILNIITLLYIYIYLYIK